jgi:hypothetical protein
VVNKIGCQSHRPGCACPFCTKQGLHSHKPGCQCALCSRIGIHSHKPGCGCAGCSGRHAEGCSCAYCCSRPGMGSSSHRSDCDCPFHKGRKGIGGPATHRSGCRCSFHKGNKGKAYAHREDCGCPFCTGHSSWKTGIALRLATFLLDAGFDLIPEVKFGRWRVDFYEPNLHLAFEADSDYWHKPEIDRQRDAELLGLYDLPVIRFSESEIKGMR